MSKINKIAPINLVKASAWIAHHDWVAQHEYMKEMKRNPKDRKTEEKNENRNRS